MNAEETFSYGGTHCTNGKEGVHHAGVYISSCCMDDYEAKDLANNETKDEL